VLTAEIKPPLQKWLLSVMTEAFRQESSNPHQNNRLLTLVFTGKPFSPPSLVNLSLLPRPATPTQVFTGQPLAQRKLANLSQILSHVSGDTVCAPKLFR